MDSGGWTQSGTETQGREKRMKEHTGGPRSWSIKGLEPASTSTSEHTAWGPAQWGQTPRSNAKILALCALMLKSNTETEFWGNEKNSLNFPGKGVAQQASARELCPHLPWGIGKGYIAQGSWSGVCDKAQSNKGLAFLFLCKFMAEAGVRRLSKRVCCP